MSVAMTANAQRESDRAVYSFTVGSVECVAINDGTFVYTAAQYFGGVAPGILEQALAEHDLAPDCILSPYTCLLVKTAEHVVVIDTGGDRAALRHLPPTAVPADVGHFQERFRRTGTDPSDVDRVIITHAHPDHIGGNVEATGAPFFPEARISLAREEWDYWTAEATLAAQPPLYAEPVRRHLIPLRDRVDLLDGEGEIVPGIRALPASGHTPGHIAVAIESDGKKLLYISDAALHPLHLTHPDWPMVFDLDPAAALASRRVLFDRAADSQALVLAFHFHPFPSLGHVRRIANGWRWHPIETNPTGHH
jgi:glyoxylase-like metal-dependent hydrolase (beta-lactamase superfamily II)